MMYIPHKVITCCDCGAELIANAPNQKRCPECAAKHNKKYNREWVKTKPIMRKPAKKDNHAEIVSANASFRARGLSYGHGMAMGGR